MQSNNVEVFADMGAKWYLLAAQKGLSRGVMDFAVEACYR
jgi:hypothetical protein